jgi:hypothetical protein
LNGTNKILSPAHAGGAFLLPCIDTVQGFSFCPAVYQLLTIVYGCLSAVNAIIPPQRQNRLQGFTGAFPLIFPISAHTIRQPHKPPIQPPRQTL